MRDKAMGLEVFFARLAKLVNLIEMVGLPVLIFGALKICAALRGVGFMEQITEPVLHRALGKAELFDERHEVGGRQRAMLEQLLKPHALIRAGRYPLAGRTPFVSLPALRLDDCFHAPMIAQNKTVVTEVE